MCRKERKGATVKGKEESSGKKRMFFLNYESKIIEQEKRKLKDRRERRGRRDQIIAE